MPKIATKFTAEVVVKVGRQNLTFKLPIDLTDLDSVSLEETVTDSAQAKLKESLRLAVVNLSALKKAHKAYKKAHP